MKILVTGSSGFLGKIIHNKLSSLHEVESLGRSENCGFKYDLTRKIPSLPQFDVIIHAAGKAHLNPKSDKESQSFFDVNLQGTRHLLNSLEKNKPNSFIFISTVAVYGLDSGNEINEMALLLGKSHYALSKIKAEQYLLEWGRKYNVKILIFRLPLVVGLNPPGNLGKMINAIKRGTYFSISGGFARRSMVMGEDVAELIAECLDVSGIYNLTDGYHPSFKELETLISNQFKKTKPLNITLCLAKFIGKIGDLIPVFPVNSTTINKMSQDLIFSDLSAKEKLGWKPTRVVDKWMIQ